MSVKGASSPYITSTSAYFSRPPDMIQISGELLQSWILLLRIVLQGASEVLHLKTIPRTPSYLAGRIAKIPLK